MQDAGPQSERISLIGVSTTAKVSAEAEKLRAGGRGRDRFRGWRAGLSDARQHQARGRGGAGCQLHALHGDAWHPGAAGGDLRPAPRRLRHRLRGARVRGDGGRQARHFQPDAGAAEPGRRGGDPGAVLGDVQRRRELRRRSVRVRRHAGGGRLRGDGGADRARAHRPHAADHHQLAVQPVGGAGGARGSSRRSPNWRAPAARG